MKITIKKVYIFTLCLYLMFLPLNSLSIGPFGSMLKLLSFVPITLGLTQIINLKLDKNLFYYIFYVIFVIFSVVWSLDRTPAIDKAFSIFSLFCLIFSCCNFRFDDREIGYIKKALLWSSRLSVLLILFFGKLIQGRLWLNGSFNEDPNYFCMYLVFGEIYDLQNIMTNKKISKKLLSALEFCIYLGIAFLSGSRGGTLALLVGVFGYLFGERKKISLKKKLIIVGVVAVGVILGISILSDSIAERFTISDIIKSGGSHRLDIWKQGLKTFAEGDIFRKLFGVGISNTITVFTQKGYPIKNVMHNMFLESLVELGIIGFILYFLAILRFVVASYKNEDKFAFAVVLSMVCMSLTTSISAFKPYINIMILIVIQNSLKKDIITQDNNTEEKDETVNNSSCIQC